MFGKIYRPLEVDDDLLGSLFSDAWYRREEFIIFELDGSHEVFSSETEEIERCLTSYSIDSEKLSEKLLLFLRQKSEKRLSGFSDMMVDPDIRFFSYANIRKKEWRCEEFEPKTSSLDESRDRDAIDREDFSGEKCEHCNN
jgi:hypothetical protein